MADHVERPPPFFLPPRPFSAWIIYLLSLPFCFFLHCLLPLSSLPSSLSLPLLHLSCFTLSLLCLTPISYPSPPLPASILLPVLFYLLLLSTELRFSAWFYSCLPLCPAFHLLCWPYLTWFFLTDTFFWWWQQQLSGGVLWLAVVFPWTSSLQTKKKHHLFATLIPVWMVLMGNLVWSDGCLYLIIDTWSNVQAGLNDHT